MLTKRDGENMSWAKYINPFKNIYFIYLFIVTRK